MRAYGVRRLSRRVVAKGLEFFFSSRRRHTICGRDWSSDVCSSDLESLGFGAHISRGTDQTIISVIGDERFVDPRTFESFEGVERVVPVPHRFRLASRDFHPKDRVLELRGGVRLGGNDVAMMAGPCAVESREQLQETAEAVHAAGVKVLRAGVFKPRTSPYSFKGLGEKGLLMLREDRK